MINLLLGDCFEKLKSVPNESIDLVVTDPFMGSRVTGLACVKEGRSFIGIEIDENYYKIAKKRILDIEKGRLSHERCS